MIIRVLKADPLKHAADLLVVGVFEHQKKLTGTVALVDKALSGIVSSLMKDEGFQGKTGEALLVQTHGRLGPKRMLVLGLGAEREFGLTQVREAAARAVKHAHGYAAKTVSVALPTSSGRGRLSPKEVGAALAEGAELGAYKFTTYHGPVTVTEHKKRQASELTIIASTPTAQRQLEAGVATGKFMAEATMAARDLVNTPASDMTPKHLVDVAKQVAAASKRVSLEVFDEKEIRRRGMGALLAVAKGSEEPPYFIHLSYKPKAVSRKTKKVFIVGKGITFDSGGLSLKPSSSMESMKTDMAGGAAVLSVFSKMSDIDPHVEVHGLVPVTENMPSGRATKPGDIARALNGKTIEILNTDAEGRLILADALAFAGQNKADVIVDLATLTGACMVALGMDVAGLFTNNTKLARELKAAADVVGEPIWELPLVKEYKAKMKSRIADVKNIGDRWGGAIEGALFLQEFVGEIPWAHLDIAGPAWTESETSPLAAHGGTGFGVRTLIEFLKKQK